MPSLLDQLLDYYLLVSHLDCQKIYQVKIKLNCINCRIHQFAFVSLNNSVFENFPMLESIKSIIHILCKLAGHVRGNQEFVGCWWLGFATFGVLLLVTALPLLAFPPSLKVRYLSTVYCFRFFC